MLIAFLINDQEDWKDWREAMSRAPGKSVIHIADMEPDLHAHEYEREDAVDEVDTFDDDELDDSGAGNETREQS